jgi:hypothetical protein
MMQVKFLVNSHERATGAMFEKNLQEMILVFVYPTPAPHLFHTFFCPNLRVVALNDKGQFLFDKVIPPNRFVRLPACTVVVESAPDVDIRPYLESILSTAFKEQLPQHGAWEAGVPVDSLIFALLAESVSDLRRVRDVGLNDRHLESIREHFDVWERGQIASSAGFILDFSRAYDIPSGALRLSRSVLEAERPHLDELFAASVAGVPWRTEVDHTCLRCGRGGYWRAILQSPIHASAETAWRYLRPENFVPLCHRCVDTLEFHHDAALRITLAEGLWGKRFEAFWHWHENLENRCLHEWDKLAFPLWPEEYGGITWASGSGALKHAEPRGPKGVYRTEAQIQTLKQALFSKRIQKRHLANTPLHGLLESEDITLLEA